MRKISMEGSGVIDLGRLYDYKETLGFFAQQLSYPEDTTYFQQADEHFSSDNPAYRHVLAYLEGIKNYSLDEIQELYVETFDFNESSTLFMTFFKYKDARERGQMLARLKVLYEMFGLAMPEDELSDYLPLICEFIYGADWHEDPRAKDSFSLLFAVVEDGTYHLLETLEKVNNPYFSLVKALREMFKACLLREALG